MKVADTTPSTLPFCATLHVRRVALPSPALTSDLTAASLQSTRFHYQGDWVKKDYYPADYVKDTKGVTFPGTTLVFQQAAVLEEGESVKLATGCTRWPCWMHPPPVLAHDGVICRSPPTI